MLTLVGAGYGVGFMTATKIPVSQRPDVVIRPLALDAAVITTYLLLTRKQQLIGFAGAIYRPPPGPFERLTQRTAPLKIGHRHEDCVPLHSSLCRTYAEGGGDFQYQCERGYAPRARSCPYASELYQPWTRIHLSDSLRQAGSTHRLAEGQCRLGFAGGCCRGRPVERCASASPEASINRPNFPTLKISLLAIMVARLFDPIALWGPHARRHQPVFLFNFRLAMAPGVPSSHLSALLALQRAEEPEVTISFHEVTADDLIAGLPGRPCYDAGMTLEDRNDPSLKSQPLDREHGRRHAVALSPADQVELTIAELLDYSVFRCAELPFAGSAAAFSSAVGQQNIGVSLPSR